METMIMMLNRFSSDHFEKCGDGAIDLLLTVISGLQQLRMHNAPEETVACNRCSE
jgi:hypothetical protein